MRSISLHLGRLFLVDVQSTSPVKHPLGVPALSDLFPQSSSTEVQWSTTRQFCNTFRCRVRSFAMPVPWSNANAVPIFVGSQRIALCRVAASLGYFPTGLKQSWKDARKPTWTQLQ
eukprot:s60_g41.t1